MLVQSLRRRQAPQRVRPQVQTVEMSDGHFGPAVAGIVRGGFVPMAIPGKAGVAGQLRDVGQTVMESSVGGGQQSSAHIPDEIAPARAVEGGEIIGVAGRVLEAQAMLLPKGAPAFGHFQHALNAQADKVLVGKIRARVSGRAGGGQALERFKKNLVHGVQIW